MSPTNPRSHRDLLKITLRRKTNNSKLPKKQDVFDALIRLEIHPVSLSQINSEFIVKLDTEAEADGLLADLAKDGARPLSALGLKPLVTPFVTASRSILVRNLDPQLGGRDAD